MRGGRLAFRRRQALGGIGRPEGELSHASARPLPRSDENEPIHAAPRPVEKDGDDGDDESLAKEGKGRRGLLSCKGKRVSLARRRPLSKRKAQPRSLLFLPRFSFFCPVLAACKEEDGNPRLIFFSCRGFCSVKGGGDQEAACFFF